MKTIAITGASGAMGKETLKAVMSSHHNFKVKLLLLNSDRFFGSKIKRQFKDRVSIIYGDIRTYQNCLDLVSGSDYVLHLAALIPPKADKNQNTTISVNYGGTKNIVDAINSLPKKPKLVHISTVAIYGNRNYLHPWGRVGDPLLPSIFDVYATSKMKAERYVLESNLPHFVVLRQTGILYDDLLINNVSDGLMFHTPWNTPIEWVTAVDSGRLMMRILERDLNGDINCFWNKVYNIGGGHGCRQTGYDVFDNGFKIIGGTVEEFFEPLWNAENNFHCFWFSDSDVLNNLFQFQSESSRYFWDEYKKKHPLYSVAKILPPKLLRKMIIEPLLCDKNAPMRWLKDNNTPRITAIYDKNTLQNSHCSWHDYPLLKNNRVPTGYFDYEKIISEPNYNRLNHGYDESKHDSELDLEDMKQVAKYRGGECLSTNMIKGDLYTPLQWRCHKGHVFFATPYTILKAGHWCDSCAPLTIWDYDLTVPHIPFYQQIWYDTHHKEERKVFAIVDNETFITRGSYHES